MIRLGSIFVFISLCGLVGGARAETALKVSASCREVMNGIRPDGIYFKPAGDFCWGAFAVLQYYDKALGTCSGERVEGTTARCGAAGGGSGLYRLGCFGIHSSSLRS